MRSRPPFWRHPSAACLRVSGPGLGFIAALLTGVADGGAPSAALPANATVAAGRAQVTTTTANTLTVTESSARAIIDWTSFAIGPAASVTFVQPTSSAAVLNRVTGDTASTIAGQLVGNGQVFLVNPNGIAITKSGRVEVGGGFIGSTLGIMDGDFMAGRLDFLGPAAPASISNAGTIAAGPGGTVALLGGAVSNSGTLSVPLGRVGLGAGQSATLDLQGDGFLQIALPPTAVSASGQRLIDESGTIAAVGGRVELRAATVAQAWRDAVHVSGAVSAQSVSGHPGLLIFDGGPGGAVTLDGTVSAAGDTAAGGRVSVTGQSVTVGANAAIDADGTTGGSVVIRSSRSTEFAGTISATGHGGNGGSVEVSSDGVLQYLGSADLRSVGGRTGNLLLDPYDVTISAGPDGNYTPGTFTATGNDSVINAATLQNALATANVTVSTGSGGTQGGNITVASPLVWTSTSTLNLLAAGNIALNGNLTAIAGGLSLSAGSATAAISAGGALNVGTFNLAQGAWTQNGANLPGFQARNFVLGANASFLRAVGGTGTPGSPFLLADIYGVQGIGSSTSYLADSYSLVDDIDASSTAGWNSGSGFVPIGVYGATGFSGTFNGQNHAVLNVYVNRPSTLTGVGLFGYASAATLENVDLLNATIIGNGTSTSAYTGTGALVGVIDGTSTITNSLSTGTVTDTQTNTGGLVGAFHGTLTLTNSSSAASVTGNNNVGGLVGGTLATISAASLSASGAVSGTGTNVGGLIGLLGGGGSMTNATSSGSVTGAAGGAVGGLIGTNGASLTYAYATGAVAGGSTVGGLVGINNGTIANSFWNTSTSGQAAGYGSNTGTIASLTGQTTAAMQTQSTYTGWDFATTWYLTSGYYPTLRNGTTILGQPGGNLTISTAADSARNFNATSVQNLLGAGNVLVSTTNGTLTVQNPVGWSSTNSLDLAASGALNVNAAANLAASGAANLGLYVAAGTSTGGAMSIANATISTAGGNLSMFSPNAGGNQGVVLNGSTVSVGAGSGTLLGGSTTTFGAYLNGAVNLQATTGTLTVMGTSQAPNVVFGAGTELDQNTVLTTTGNITLSGSGGTGTGSGHGVVLRTGASITSTGNLAISGNADSTSGGYNGIYFEANNTLTANSGNLVATGGGLTSDVGILQNGGTLTLVNNGAGSFSLSGTGSANHDGFSFAAGTSMATTGAVSISGSSSGWTGFDVYGGNGVVTAGGNLSITGTSGVGTGILFGGVDTIANNGGGSVTLDGISTGAATGAPGVGFRSSATLTAAGGVTLSGTSANNDGLYFAGANALTHSGSGTLSVNGTGAGSGTAGVYLNTASLINGVGGTLTVSGSDSATAAVGVQIASGQTVTTSGPITFTDAGASAATTAMAVAGAIVDNVGALTFAPVSPNNIVIATGGSVTSTGGGALDLATTGSGGITNNGTIAQGPGSGGSIALTTVNGPLSNAGTLAGASSAGGITLTTTGTGSIADSAGTISQAGSGAITLQATGSGSIAADTIGYANAAPSTLNIAATAGNVQLDGAIASTGGALGLTVSGQNVAGSGNLNGNGGAMSFAPTGSGTLSGVLSGAGNLTMSGPGTLDLSGTNTFSGGTTLSAGTLGVANDAALGSGLVILNGGTLASNVFNANTVTVANPVQINPVVGNGLYTPSGANLTLSGDLTGSGTVTKTGPNSVLLAGDNSGFTGTYVNAAANTFFTSTSAGSAAATWVVASGFLGTDGIGGTVDLGSLAGSGNLGSQFGGLTTNFSIGANGQSTTFSGAIATNVQGGPVALTKVGTGTLTLSGINPYTGATAVEAGTLRAGSSTAWGANSALTLANGATLDLAGFANSVGSLTGTGTVTNSGASAATLTAGGDNTSTTFAGVLQDGAGTASLTKSGSGVLTLSGANTYGGATTVDGGTLALTGRWNVGANTATTAVASGATLTGDGVITAATLRDSGPGAVNLSGANQIGALATSGTVGTFALNDAQALSVASLTASGAVTLTDASDITILAGGLISGANPVLSAVGAFDNQAGAGAVSATTGRWLIYSANPAADTFAGLDSRNTALWNAGYAAAPPAAIAPSGNRYLFALQPTLTVSVLNDSKTYGTDATAALAGDYAVAGSSPGVSGAFLADGAGTAYLGAPTLASPGAAAAAPVAGGPYAITMTPGSFAPLDGYAVLYQGTGTLAVNPAPITVSARGGASGQGASPPNPGLSATGLQNGQTVDALTGLSNSFAITRTSGAGDYPLTVVGSLQNSNYTVTTTSPGTWTVVPEALAERNPPSMIASIPRHRGMLCIDRDGPHYVEQMGFPLTALADSRFDRRGCLADDRDAWRQDPSRLQ